MSPKEFKEFISDDGMRLAPFQLRVITPYRKSSPSTWKITPERREYIMGNLVVDEEILRTIF